MSSSLAIKYQPLSQSAPSDDDDEDEGFHDNVLFDSRLVYGPRLDHRNVFELEKLGQPRFKSSNGVSFIMKGRSRQICLLVTVLVVILLGVMVAVLFPILNHAYNHGLVSDVHQGASTDWVLILNQTWADTAIVTVDIDLDGREDVLVGVSARADRSTADPDRGTWDRIGAGIYAVRGFDGKVLWHINLHWKILGIICKEVDLNKDGNANCIVFGYNSTCLALNVQTGDILWSIEANASHWSSHFVTEWSIGHVLIMPDLDSDGVLDLLVVLSEDKKASLASTQGKKTRFILLAGKTGRLIGQNFWEFQASPQVSPVKYLSDTGAVYVLFGLLEQDKRCSLVAISLPDLYLALTGRSLETHDPPSYTWLQSQLRTAEGVTNLYRVEGVGHVLTPVLADVNKDGLLDILVSTSDGSVSLLDGKTLQREWNIPFKGMLIHRPPTPGYFDSDKVLDFMVHLHVDHCDGINVTQTVIMSGRDGRNLWSYLPRDVLLSSELTLTLPSHEQSVFMVVMDAVNATQELWQLALKLQLPLKQDSLGKNSGKILSPLKLEYEQVLCAEIIRLKGHVTCSTNLDSLSQRVLLLDGEIKDRPLILAEIKAFNFNYKLKSEAGGPCERESAISHEQIDMCAVLVPTVSSGAIADVDGDGFWDYIHMSQMVGASMSDTKNPTGLIGSVRLSKHSLSAAIARAEFQIFNPQPRSGVQLEHVQSWQFSLSSSNTSHQSPVLRLTKDNCLVKEVLGPS